VSSGRRCKAGCDFPIKLATRAPPNRIRQPTIYAEFLAKWRSGAIERTLAAMLALAQRARSELYLTKASKSSLQECIRRAATSPRMNGVAMRRSTIRKPSSVVAMATQTFASRRFVTRHSRSLCHKTHETSSQKSADHDYRLFHDKVW
jgi:hypothetical protein